MFSDRRYKGRTLTLKSFVIEAQTFKVEGISYMFYDENNNRIASVAVKNSIILKQ